MDCKRVCFFSTRKMEGRILGDCEVSECVLVCVFDLTSSLDLASDTFSVS